MASGICFKFDASHHAVMVLLVLEATVVTIKGVVSKFQNCFSELCGFFGRFDSISLQQRRMHKNFNFGTATSYHELRVLKRDCAAQKSEAAKL